MTPCSGAQRAMASSCPPRLALEEQNPLVPLGDGRPDWVRADVFQRIDDPQGSVLRQGHSVEVAADCDLDRIHTHERAREEIQDCGRRKHVHAAITGAAACSNSSRRTALSAKPIMEKACG